MIPRASDLRLPTAGHAPLLHPATRKWLSADALSPRPRPCPRLAILNMFCVPQIVEGNWVVKRAAGTTPAILGTKLKQHHFRGDNYLETDLEIGAYHYVQSAYLFSCRDDAVWITLYLSICGVFRLASVGESN